MNQSINQSINQSSNQAIKQSVNQSINQSSTNQSIINQSSTINQSINHQSINQPTNHVMSHLKGSRPHLVYKITYTHHCVPAEHCFVSSFIGSAVDHGPPMGLLPHGCHSPPPPTLADPQPLPGSHQQEGDIREQGLPVGTVSVHEREVWP